MPDKYIAVIQAGGKGTRLRGLTKNKIPKPLLEMNGKPMLEWQIENLIRYGIREVIIIVGHLGEKIQEYFGNGDKWKIQISYIKEEQPLGSAGALYFLKGRYNKDILLIFGDVMFDIDWNRFIAFHEEKNGQATILVHPNSHPYDSDIVIMDAEKKVISLENKCENRCDYYANCVNSGLYILKMNVLNDLKENQFCDLEKDMLSELIINGMVYGYKSSEYVKDAGTPERFKTVSDEQKEGIWSKRNLENEQKCIFLDRDGTINKYSGLISNPEEFELEDNAAEAIRMINESGYLAIVITNQPVVARGMCDISMVEKIHRKMDTLLGEKGAYLDDIVFCPHHPDKGFPEENIEYKINCNCRKPATGMIDKMIERYNIDVSASYMVGDTTTDIQTGVNAGLKTILVRTGESGKDRKYNIEADMVVQDILEAVKSILLERESGKLYRRY